MRIGVAIFVGALLILPAAGAGASSPTANDEVGGAMCPTHGVLEAVCTLCNPRLAAVFKAKGDWCAAHELPESFCPKCRPAQGGRPAADITADKAPTDGLMVKLRTADTARLAGFQTVTARSRPARTFVAAVLRVVYDATRVATINARAPGVLRALDADVGTLVRASAPLATIESAAGSADRSKLDSARARLVVASASAARQRSLNAQGVVAQKDLLAAEQELAVARSEVDSAQTAQQMAGVVGPGGRIALTSPIAGVVTQRKASVGQLVNGDDMLFEVVDTSSVWAELEIPETDIAPVRTGQTVEITLDSLPGKTWSGTLSYVAPSVDLETRTIRGRVVLANPDGQLRANMFGQARILVGESRSAISVPRAAVQRVKEVALVFVRRSAVEYETRRVQLGQSDEESIDIVKGLAAGDEVVTTGSFLLKTETLKDSIGAGCCEADAKK